MTIKMIDLLVKLANCEEVPKKIKITIDEYTTLCDYIFTYDSHNSEYLDDDGFVLGARLILDRVLNKPVEILESGDDYKIQKITPKYLDVDDSVENKIETIHYNCVQTINKVNEIVPELNKLKKKIDKK